MTAVDYVYVCEDCGVCGFVSTPGYLNAQKSKHANHSCWYTNRATERRRYQQVLKHVASSATEFESSHWRKCPECDGSLVEPPMGETALECRSCGYSEGRLR